MKTQQIEFDLEWEDETAGNVMLTVLAVFTGNYLPARYSPIDDAHPAEWPDVDYQVTLDGQDYGLTDPLYEAIDDKAWNLWDEELR